MNLSMNIFTLVTALTLLIGFKAEAKTNTLKLGGLECVASNGVLIKTTALTRSGVVLETSWGLLKRRFVADLGLKGVESQNLISLKDEAGVAQYVISIVIKPKGLEAQSGVGTLFMAGNSLTPFIAIAGINCDLLLR